MTYEPKDKSKKCQNSECKNRIFDPERGAPRKYCDNCRDEMQKKKDLDNKIRKRENRKIEKLAKDLNKPGNLEKLKESVEKLYLLEQHTRQELLNSLPEEIFSINDKNIKPITFISKYDDHPKMWSRRELIDIIRETMK